MKIGPIEIKFKSVSPGIKPFITNSFYGTQVPISSENLRAFGYYVAGCELGIIGTGNEALEEDKLKDIIINELCDVIKHNERNPDYQSIRSFLINNYVPKSKIEKDSIKRILDILKENYQDLWKHKLKESESEKYNL